VTNLDVRGRQPSHGATRRKRVVGIKPLLLRGASLRKFQNLSANLCIFSKSKNFTTDTCMIPPYASITFYE
jgi:hypothetical protein